MFTWSCATLLFLIFWWWTGFWWHVNIDSTWRVGMTSFVYCNTPFVWIFFYSLLFLLFLKYWCLQRRWVVWSVGQRWPSGAKLQNEKSKCWRKPTLMSIRFERHQGEWGNYLRLWRRMPMANTSKFIAVLLENNLCWCMCKSVPTWYLKAFLVCVCVCVCVYIYIYIYI